VLHEFLTFHHETIVARARLRLLARWSPHAGESEVRDGVPRFLRQLERILQRENLTSVRPLEAAQVGAPSEMGASAARQGGNLRQAGFNIAEVVQAYGDICQAITDLATELQSPITADEFRTLNRCLDEVIAEAVTEFARQRDRSVASQNTERLGIFAHELRNQLNTALLAYEALKMGAVGISSNTGAMLGRSLLGLRNLIDTSLAEVRLQAGANRRDRVELAELIEEVALAAHAEARGLGKELVVAPVADGVMLDVDRQLLAAALGHLLQNACKFTRPSSRIVLRTDTISTPDCVLIEIEDECGGLPPGLAEELFKPFAQHGQDKSGLGLGLLIARKGVESNGGTLGVRDLPGIGCVFTVDLPRAPSPQPGG
jgi:signal transduction histidine kinase